MIILGLGSNVGHRLTHLRTAIQLLKKTAHLEVICASPIYQSQAQLTPLAPADWAKPYLNLAIEIKTSLTPQACLQFIKSIENTMGRVQTERWAPRIIDIDILIWDNLQINEINLQIPHTCLAERPFALFPLLDLHPFWQHPDSKHRTHIQEALAQWGNRLENKAPFETRPIQHRIEGSRLMGILNITPDSYLESSRHLNSESALQHAEWLVQGGAEIIDIGGESTRPNATLISQQEEWRRLEPTLQALQQLTHRGLDRPILCVDTRYPETAEAALRYGITWLNDVSGLSNPRYIALIKESGCTAIFMHHLGLPADKKKVIPQNVSVIDTVYTWLQERMYSLIDQGLQSTQLIADIGIGFGKSSAQDVQLLQSIQTFKSLGIPLLVGHSCKYFIGQTWTNLPASERHLETAMISAYLSQAEVDYLRVHDPAFNTRAIQLAAHFSVAPGVSTEKKSLTAQGLEMFSKNQNHE